jgi:hypothetical protein
MTLLLNEYGIKYRQIDDTGIMQMAQELIFVQKM